MRLEYPKTFLAQERGPYDPRQGHLHEVSEPSLYATPWTSPQRELIALDAEQWRTVQRRPSSTYSKRRAMLGQQLPVLDLGTSARILWAFKAL